MSNAANSKIALVRAAAMSVVFALSVDVCLAQQHPPQPARQGHGQPGGSAVVGGPGHLSAGTAARFPIIPAGVPAAKAASAGPHPSHSDSKMALAGAGPAPVLAQPTAPATGAHPGAGATGKSPLVPAQALAARSPSAAPQPSSPAPKATAAAARKALAPGHSGTPAADAKGPKGEAGSAAQGRLNAAPAEHGT